MPFRNGANLFFSTFYDGGPMLNLNQHKPGATMMWKGKSNNELQTDGLHSTLSGPVIVNGHIYGICSDGQFRCMRVKDGERLWETQAVTKERAHWATGHIVVNGDRLFINNDRGELIIVQPDPAGYKEVSRTALIKPTSPPGNRRQLVHVNWSHPAYANRHIYARNDEELICVSLAADGVCRARLYWSLGRWRSRHCPRRATRAFGCRRSTFATFSTSSPAAATRWR